MKHAILVVTLSVLAVGIASADFLDEFNSSVLDPGWLIGWEDPAHWSLTARPGFMRIVTKYALGDTIWNIFFHREGIAGNVEVTAKVIARPVQQGHCTFIHADDDSLAQRKPRVIAGFGNIAGYGEGVLGWIDSYMTLIPYVDTICYLRIRTNGDTVFTEYSPDNSSWSAINSAWSPPFTEHQQSGLNAMNYPPFGATPGTPEIEADFDWFHLVATTGVEEKTADGKQKVVGKMIPKPNPFVSYTRITGHERESVVVFDALGRRVGAYAGSRVCDGLAPGVYFVRGLDVASTPVRIVKVR
jgi:hypothetical protein